MTWRGDTPYFLVLLRPGEPEPFTLDLDEPQWLQTRREEIQAPAVWELVRKEGAQVTIRVWMPPGSEPFYVCRHFGSTATVGEILCFGIGYHLDGITTALWVLPDGSVVPDDLVDPLGSAFLRSAVRPVQAGSTP